MAVKTEEPEALVHQDRVAVDSKIVSEHHHPRIGTGRLSCPIIRSSFISFAIWSEGRGPGARTGSTICLEAMMIWRT